jgi:hypothetical protein
LRKPEFDIKNIFTSTNRADSCTRFFIAEDDMSESNQTPPSSPFSQKACFDILEKVCPASPLPYQCESYEEVKVALQRKNSNKQSQAIAFQGMHSGEATAAMAARDRGQLHHAQVQRRMTNNKSKRSFF